MTTRQSGLPHKSHVKSTRLLTACCRHILVFVCVHLFSIPDILLLGVLCDGDTLAVGLELMLDDFSVGIVLYTESVVQDASDVIVPEEEGGQVRERRYVTIRISSQLLQRLFLFTPFFPSFLGPTELRHIAVICTQHHQADIFKVLPLCFIVTIFGNWST